MKSLKVKLNAGDYGFAIALDHDEGSQTKCKYCKEGEIKLKGKTFDCPECDGNGYNTRYRREYNIVRIKVVRVMANQAFNNDLGKNHTVVKYICNVCGAASVHSDRQFTTSEPLVFATEAAAQKLIDEPRKKTLSRIFKGY